MQDFQPILIKTLFQIASALDRIANALERLRSDNEEKAPNLQKPLEGWTNFDWTSIEAVVERSDEYGPAIVSWKGKQFTRRSPLNKFSEAVWFSRCTGRDDRGELQYDRLITFKRLPSAEPVPERVSRLR